MAKLTDQQQAYLDSLKASAGSSAMAETSDELARSQMGATIPLDQSVAVPRVEDTKPSGWFWRRFRR